MRIAGAAILVAAIVTAPAVAAKTFRHCYTEEGTNKATCIDEDAIAVNGDIRSAPVWQGGPKGVTKTPYFLVSDCKKRISTLQDRQGVNFAGGRNNTTPAIESLSGSLCTLTPARKDPSLKQFQ